MHAPLRVGLVAGEASGDTLGAALIKALRRLAPDAQFFGVAGPKMLAAGCECWEPAESLAVMGLFEILRHLPRLLRLRARIRRHFLRARPDVFVGIDAPGIQFRPGARDLRAAGIPTVQYVSPQVWAWRQSRVDSMHRSVDLVLCLLPFEKRFYDNQGVAAEFVGHPLADAIPLTVDRSQARSRLGLPADAEVVALLPGSRRGEVRRLAADFAATVRLARGQAPPTTVHRAHGECRHPGDFWAGVAARRPAGAGAADGRPGADGAHRLECRAGRLGDGESGGRPVQAPHGRRVPSGRDDRLGHKPSESGEIQVLCAAKSACGSARRRRVFSGTNRSGVDRGGALDVAGRRGAAGRVGARIRRHPRRSKRDASARAAQAILALVPRGRLAGGRTPG